MMIAERQNREKNLHRRRKKEKIIEIANNQEDDEADGGEDELEDAESDMEKSTMNVAMVETNEAVTVNKHFGFVDLNHVIRIIQFFWHYAAFILCSVRKKSRIS